MATLTDKLIKEDVTTLREAYRLRKREYEALRSAAEWSGAVLHAGILLELALKIAICQNMDVTHLPQAFQIHNVGVLLYCSGLRNKITNSPDLQHNFGIIESRCSMDLRYKGATMTNQDADEVHQALFDPSNGMLTFLSSFL
jgi:hypothetical protein